MSDLDGSNTRVLVDSGLTLPGENNMNACKIT